MAQCLDGIERIIYTTNPETLVSDTYVCAGYFNTGKKLVDWYRPLSNEGNHHSAEFLKLCSQKHEWRYEVKVGGQE